MVCYCNWPNFPGFHSVPPTQPMFFAYILLEHRGLTDQVKTMIRASSAGDGVSRHSLVYVHLKQPSAVVVFLLSAVSKKTRISTNTAVHSHAIAAWPCLRGGWDAGYLAFWVRFYVISVIMG